jgi:hypothetical protein
MVVDPKRIIGKKWRAEERRGTRGRWPPPPTHTKKLCSQTGKAWPNLGPLVQHSCCILHTRTSDLTSGFASRKLIKAKKVYKSADAATDWYKLLIPTLLCTYVCMYVCMVGQKRNEMIAHCAFLQ